tara:strand:- start:732 stop:2510 length:1779 start_codon:yes stop_codon:yes gene_type:complete
MADDITLNTGAGGDTLGADDISGTKFQRIKLIHGIDGVNDGDVSNTNPLPISAQNLVSTNNSTTSPLGISATYTGSGEDVSVYAMITVAFKGASASTAPGTIYLEFSPDNTNWDRSIAVTVGDVASHPPHTLTPVNQYFRVRYTNGAVAQTELRLQTMYHAAKAKGLTSRAGQTITDETDVDNVRAVLAGKDVAGNYRNCGVDAEGHIMVHVHDPVTAFGEVRTAHLSPKVHLTYPYNINGDLIHTTEANSGTVTQADSMAVLQTSTNSAGSAELESRDALVYRSGLGGLARFTGMFTTGVANSEQIIGVGDTEDGFFFGYNGTAFGVLRRSDSVDTWTAMTSWNVDRMDGSAGILNPTGMTMDQTKLNVFYIKYQWLGAGAITFGMEDSTTGSLVPVHIIQYANTYTVPSLYNPTLPLHVNVTNSGNTSNLTMKSASMAAFVEGESKITGPANSVQGTSTHSTETAFFHVRNKTTNNSKTNRVRTHLSQLSTGNDANALSTFRIYLNATLTGTPTWTDVNGNDSCMDTDTVQAYSSGGKLLFQGVVGKDSGQVFDLSGFDPIMEPGDIITVTSESGTSGSQSASIVWREDF